MMTRTILVSAALLLVGCQASVQAGARAEGSIGDDGDATPGDSAATITAETFAPIHCNHSRTKLAPGTYKGDLVISGNHCTVEGAGQDQTVIEGALLLSGNHNTVDNLSVVKPSRIEGNHNSATGVSFRGGVESSGNHNQP